MPKYKKDIVNNVHYLENKYGEVESVFFYLEIYDLQFSIPIRYRIIENNDKVLVQVIYRQSRNGEGNYHLKFIYNLKSMVLVVSPFMILVSKKGGIFKYFLLILSSVTFLGLLFANIIIDFWDEGTVFWLDILDNFTAINFFIFCIVNILLSTFLAWMLKSEGIILNIRDIFPNAIKLIESYSLDKLKLGGEFRSFDLGQDILEYNIFGG